MRWVFTVLFLWTAARGVSDVASYANYLMTAPFEDVLNKHSPPRPTQTTFIRVDASTTYQIAIWDGAIRFDETKKVSELEPVNLDDGIRLFADIPGGGWAFLYLENPPRIRLNNSDLAYLPEVPGKTVIAPVVVNRGTVEISESYIYHNYYSTKSGGVYATGGGQVRVRGGQIAHNKAEVGAVLVDKRSVVELEGVSIFKNEGSTTGAVYTFDQATFTGRRVIFENQTTGSFATGVLSSGQSGSFLVQCEFKGQPISEDYKSCLLDPEVTDIHSCGNSSDVTSPVLHANDTATITVVGSRLTQQSTERGTILSSGFSQINVRHTNFTGNVAHTGGGLFIENGRGGTAIVLNCHFHDNVARFGGAMVLGGNESSMVNSCTFTHNRAILGGAIWGNKTQNVASSTEGGGKASSAAKITVMLSNFADNSARSYGGALFAQWADIRSNLSSFHNNTAGKSGGAVYIANSKKLNITDTKFSQNFAGRRAGAIKGLNVSSVNLIRSVFSFNTATWKGGAFYLKHSLINIQNSTFTNNYCLNSSQYEL